MLVWCACAAVRTEASAQYAPSRIGAGASYELLSFYSPDQVGIESISLLTVPLAARLRLFDGIAFELSSAWASGRLVASNGAESTLSGPTDTEVRLVLGLGRDLLTITGVALLPTGSASLSAGEAEIAGIIAADVLPFRISSWGSGGGAGISSTLALPAGRFTAAFSFGYLVAREFEPLSDDAFTYRPGDQLSARAAFDWTGNSSKAALVLSMNHYSEDQIDGTNLFLSGTRYQGLASYAFAAGPTIDGIVYVGVLHRDESEFLDQPTLLSAQDLVFAGAGLEARTGQLLIRPSFDLRMLRRDDGVDQGYTSSAGAEVELPAGPLTFVPALRGRFGKIIVRDRLESDFIGLDVGLAIRFGAAQ